METKIMETRVTPLLSFILQKKCIKKCLEHFKPSYAPTLPDELADEENDPFRPRPRPSFPPLVVSTACVMFNNIFFTLTSAWNRLLLQILWGFFPDHEPRAELDCVRPNFNMSISIYYCIFLIWLHNSVTRFKIVFFSFWQSNELISNYKRLSR